MSYKSPINITEIVTQIAENFDEKSQTYIIKTMANYGVNISPGELMRALEYDRNQYEKGYEDGKKDRPKGKWEASVNGTDYRVCSNCGYERHAGTKYNFCPICGADMRGEE